MIAVLPFCCTSMLRLTPDQLQQQLLQTDDLLIVQDLDGVCMQLVKDPLTRRMDPSYVDAVAALDGQFAVLTNGEHEGRRGVNRLVEQALGNSDLPRHEGRYLPGLAAGGVQLQDRFGDLSHPGVSPAEMAFLAAAPTRMEALLMERLPGLLPQQGVDDLAEVAKAAVLVHPRCHPPSISTGFLNLSALMSALSRPCRRCSRS